MTLRDLIDYLNWVIWTPESLNTPVTVWAEDECRPFRGIEFRDGMAILHP